MAAEVKTLRSAINSVTGRATEFVIVGRNIWLLFSLRSSKRAAESTVDKLVKSFPQTKRSQFRVFKTDKGWGVFQRSPNPRARLTVKDLIGKGSTLRFKSPQEIQARSLAESKRKR